MEFGLVKSGGEFGFTRTLHRYWLGTFLVSFRQRWSKPKRYLDVRLIASVEEGEKASTGDVWKELHRAEHGKVVANAP